MLQYLLNATAIWLLCLIIFDGFLRREAYHTYNRIYLMGSFLLGLLLPLWQWRSEALIYSTGINKPIEQAAISKRALLEVATPSSISLSWQNGLIMLYLVGVAVSLLLLAKEMVIIIGLYHKGKKTRDGVWTIVETGRSHTPFSAFRYIFINNKDNYTADELRIILTHEEKHGHLLHFADLLFIQLCKAAFWFHPLVYVYAQRLVMVHEYQADAAINAPVKDYGQFLIEQAMLQPAPSLSHSFNRSPIKKRIVMLTRTSSALSNSKTLLAIPVLLVCMLCFTKNAFSDDKRVRDGNKITYRGNVFELQESPADTVTMIDPVTGANQIRISVRDPWLVKMNGNKIYNDNDIDKMGRMKLGDKATEKAALSSGALKEYLLSRMDEEVRTLKDGRYFMHINQILLDENGKIVYYIYGGISTNQYAEPDKSGIIDKATQDKFAKKISHLINNAPLHTPAYINGKAEAFLINDIEFWNPFTVRGGKVIAL